MSCDLWRAKIDAYVDGELPAEERFGFDAHVRACASCTAEALNRIEWKQATRLAGKRYSPSAEFRRRIEKQLAPPARVSSFLGWMPRLAFAAAVLLVAFLAADRWLISPRPQPLAELADLHVATLASPNPVDVASSDRHTVKPWFAGKLPFTFNLPELENTPLTILGGRVAYLQGAPGAQLLFQMRKHRVSVFIFQDSAGAGRGLGRGDTMTKEMSFPVETWSEGGLRYFVIGDVSPEDIRQVGGLMKRAAR